MLFVPGNVVLGLNSAFMPSICCWLIFIYTTYHSTAHDTSLPDLYLWFRVLWFSHLPLYILWDLLKCVEFHMSLLDSLHSSSMFYPEVICWISVRLCTFFHHHGLFRILMYRRKHILILPTQHKTASFYFCDFFQLTHFFKKSFDHMRL